MITEIKKEKWVETNRLKRLIFKEYSNLNHQVKKAFNFNKYFAL